ncbi:MAG: transcriptional coactivator p15/PC4 family protein [Deltaproteobacteria bacterium]|nr:transcriptional coactivator p15/PC4 family protein [Deltaproteobacteria bacterium]
MIPVPENAKKATGDIVVYAHEFKGKEYINVRKTYVDKETGELAIGKGLTCLREQWEEIVAAMTGLKNE